MSVTLLISILIRLLAFAWSIVILRRSRDWRFAFLSIMIALMAIRQILTLTKGMESTSLSFSANLEELPGFLVSILVFFGMFFLERVLAEHRRVESEIRRSHEWTTVLLGNLSGMAYRCRNDSDWTMEYVSDGCLELTGYTPAQLLENKDLNFSDLIHPMDQDWLWKKCQLSLENRQPCKNEYRIVIADGTEKWVWDQAQGIYSKTGELLRIEGFITDISERKRAETALRQSEERHRMIIGNIHEIVFRGKFGRDPIRDFRVDFLSPQTEVVIGYRPEEFKRDPALWSTLLEPEDLPAVAEATHKLIQTGLPVVRVYRLRHKNKGESRWIEDRVSPILDPNGGVYGMMGVARDITDRVKLEEELRHAGKLEAIGQLAGGIAHEFNNLLTSVIGHLELTRQQIEKTSPLVPLIATAEQAAHKGISLTQQLLTFSRRTPPSSEPVDLGKVSEEVIRLLRLTFDRRIQVRVEADSDLWSVKADANQMNQIVMNLCVNARDSATEKMDVNQTGLKKDWKPKITVKAANRALLEKDVVHHAAGRPGDFVCLSVTDNGLGISRKTRERMFDPFFTTKPVGVGTGLGLSTVHGIVQQHHGWIEVDSTEGEGTTFRVYLEKCAQSAKPLERKADTPPVTGGTETILFVDDEPAIRRLGKTILEHHGYTVLLANDGDAALELFSRENKRLGLIILDLTMPHRSGFEVLEKVRQENPDTKVIISSGNLSAEKEKGLLVPGLVHFVAKPYHPEDLARSVRTLLDGIPGV